MTIPNGVGSLDDYQRAAVAHGDGAAIVLAGPGSGKTRVIVERAVRLIDEGLARPEQLLILTFSRKAASDLRERLAARLRRSYATFPITTFHAFCLSILARASDKPPRLARPAERQAAMRKALKSESNLGYPTASRALVEEALAFSALCDDYLELPLHALAPVHTRYVEQLGSEGLLDYGGLQREAVALLQANDDLRSAYAEQFRYVLVDEYQDTNVAQETLLRLITGTHRNVFCVADEDQSIYGFRGAEIENALRFEERWPGAVRYDLPINYRSGPRIVEAATSVIRLNLDTHRQKPLSAADERPARLNGRKFRHVSEEADWIAREVAALRRDGTELGEVAILARSLKHLGPPLAYALRSHGVPFHAPLSPPLHPTAAALLSLIELAQPERWDAAQSEQALDVLGSPLFGADPLELRRFRRAERTVYGALRETGAYKPFFEALAIVKRQRSAAAAVYALWERLAYFRDLQDRCRPFDAPRDDVEELEAVTALSDAANEFDGELAAFPARFRAGELAFEEWLPAEALPRDAVALLTIHQAKGLEWDAVFVCDLVEGRFPALSRSQYSVFDRESFGDRPQDEAARARRALEEERRLFYVALTRARSKVFLTATEETHEEASRALSRFYGEAHAFLEPAPDRDGFVSVEDALVALRRAGGGPPGWRELPQTENEHAMLPDGGLYTSASGLDPYENCPWQFYLGTLLELVRPRGAALVFGGILHDVLEAFHNPDEPQPQTLERLLELGEEKWRPGLITPAPLEEEHRRRLRQMLADYHLCEVSAGPAPDVLAVERRFRFPLDASTISGRIDRIDRRPDGTLRLVDYKSGKAMGAAEAEQDLQLALYALACAVEPELAALGTVSEIEYVFPRHIARGAVARRSQTVAPELAERTRERVRTLIAHIVTEQFEFSPEADCNFCDFQRICPRHYGRDVPL